MLKDIKHDISRLMALYEAERQRADALSEQLSQKEIRIAKYKEQIVDLNQQIDNLGLMNAFLAGTDKEGAKVRIDKLIREIDRCIKLLES